MHEAAAIADSGPLICLARINRLDLLPRPDIDALVKNGIYIRLELIEAILKDAGEYA